MVPGGVMDGMAWGGLCAAACVVGVWMVYSGQRLFMRWVLCCQCVCVRVCARLVGVCGQCVWGGVDCNKI